MYTPWSYAKPLALQPSAGWHEESHQVSEPEKEVVMVDRKIPRSFLLIAILPFFTAFAVDGRSQTRDAAPPSKRYLGECSNATLKGAYGVLDQGTFVGQFPGFPPPPFPVAISGILTYDGAGHFSGPITLPSFES